jgi:DNA-binding CsgD family transcriptional regulator
VVLYKLKLQTMDKHVNQQKLNNKDFYKTVINEVDIIIQINEIIDDKYFKMVWANEFYQSSVQSSLNEKSLNNEADCNNSYNPLDLISVEEVIKVLKESDNPYSTVYKYTSGSGDNRWYYAKISPYKWNKRGELIWVLCAFIDITDKIVNPERIADMRKEIAQLNNKISHSQLSKTEKSILKLLASGKSEKEIAEVQSRSIHTIKTHLKNIRKELSINKNTELVKFAIETGIA